MIPTMSRGMFERGVRDGSEVRILRDSELCVRYECSALAQCCIRMSDHKRQSARKPFSMVRIVRHPTASSRMSTSLEGLNASQRSRRRSRSPGEES